MSKMLTVPAPPLDVKPRSELGSQRDTVDAVVFGISPTTFSESDVEHDDLCSARNEETAVGESNAR